MQTYPKDIESLIMHFQKLPGVGRKTAERYAFHVLTEDQQELKQFSESIATLKTRIQVCDACGCLMSNMRCVFCNQNHRNTRQLCVVAHARDVYSFEATGYYQGVYHVLGGFLSPIDGQTPESLDIPQLLKRVQDLSIEEVILALDATLEGDATALYLQELFQSLTVRVSRLALGIPMGSSFEFIDGGTLSQAFEGRVNC